MLTPPQFKICNSITEHIYDVFESIHVCNKITQSMGSLKFSDFYRLALFFLAFAIFEPDSVHC